MKKLYEKSELGFALAWIGAYCALQSLAKPLDARIGIDGAASALCCAALALMLLRFLRGNGLLERYGFCRPRVGARGFLYYIPLALLCTSNLWNGVAARLSPMALAAHIALMLCVGLTEEALFRGLLFRALERDGARRAALISSVTFGLGHLLNLANGSGMSLAANLFQVAAATGFGYLFVAIFRRGGSLLPCVFAHAAINILSAFANEAGLSAGRRAAFALIELAIIAAYARFLGGPGARAANTGREA